MYTTHPPSTPIPLLTANNTTLPRRHQCAHFNPTSPSLTTMRCTRPVIHITLQARLRRCMTAAASAGRAPIEPHRCILRVTNCCCDGISCPLAGPACSSSTGLVRWCILLGSLSLLQQTIIINTIVFRLPWRDAGQSVSLYRSLGPMSRRRHASIGYRLRLRHM